MHHASWAVVHALCLSGIGGLPLRRLRNAVPAPVGFMSAIGGRSTFLPLQSDFGRCPTARILPWEIVEAPLRSFLSLSLCLR
jgi:hypothetical protein